MDNAPRAMLLAAQAQGAVEGGSAIITVTPVAQTVAALLAAAGAALPADTVRVYLRTTGGLTVTLDAAEALAPEASISIPTTKAAGDAHTLSVPSATCTMLARWFIPRS